jgi:hypothetical protein
MTRQKLEAALAEYDGVPLHELPWRYQDPRNKDDLAVGIMLVVRRKPGLENVAPTYNENGVLTGWTGMKMRE